MMESLGSAGQQEPGPACVNFFLLPLEWDWDHQVTSPVEAGTRTDFEA